MDVDKLIEYLVVTGQVDDNFELKEVCPVCGSPMDKIDDDAFPYYCPKCDMFINKDKTQGKEREK